MGPRGPCIGIKYYGGNPGGVVCSHPDNDAIIRLAAELSGQVRDQRGEHRQADGKECPESWESHRVMLRGSVSACSGIFVPGDNRPSCR